METLSSVTLSHLERTSEEEAEDETGVSSLKHGSKDWRGLCCWRANLNCRLCNSTYSSCQSAMDVSTVKQQKPITYYPVFVSQPEISIAA